MAKAWVMAVAGSHGGAGKTAYIERMLPFLRPNCAAVKAQTDEDAPLAVVREDPPDGQPRKDTERFLAAGAARAYLVQGPAERILETVRGIAESGEVDGVIVESNRLFRAVEPDLAVFVKGDGPPKPGAAELEAAADVIVRVNLEDEGREE